MSWKEKHLFIQLHVKVSSTKDKEIEKMKTNQGEPTHLSTIYEKIMIKVSKNVFEHNGYMGIDGTLMETHGKSKGCS